ncbi:MAG: hypothetical protein FRX49_04283 [Trebouxia sp. A1-2]|nr:MAG: hypothetical protein FRX49_04283 [Trebouxia sp. A1-2]
MQIANVPHAEADGNRHGSNNQVGGQCWSGAKKVVNNRMDRRVELSKPDRPEQLLCKLLPSATCALRGSDFDLLTAWLFPPLPPLSRAKYWLKVDRKQCYSDLFSVETRKPTPCMPDSLGAE